MNAERTISIDIEARPVLSYAMAHNRLPVISRLTVSGGERDVQGARLLLEVSTPPAPSATTRSSSSICGPGSRSSCRS